jgi:hypothetical protein
VSDDALNNFSVYLKIRVNAAPVGWVSAPPHIWRMSRDGSGMFGLSGCGRFPGGI